jgi:hypothetical protein
MKGFTVRNLPLLLALAGAASAGAVATSAKASVSIAVAFDDLVGRAHAVALFTPAEAMSTWEGGRIYTYTRVHADTGIAGDIGTGGEAWVRTLGGTVGNIGQSVEGEAVFTIGKQTLLFLQHGPAGAYEVTARGQGQFVVKADETTKLMKVYRAGSPGMLLPPQAPEAAKAATQHATPDIRVTTIRAPLARDILHERPLDEAMRTVADAWKKSHGG